LDQDSVLYDTVTSQPGVAIAPYFEARTQKPSAFHHGNRGLSRDRILREARLFDSVRAELDGADSGPSPYRGIEPVAVHSRLRAQMVARHPWLDEPPEKRITVGERIRDVIRLLAFAVVLLLVLSAPGIVLSVMLTRWQYVAAVAAAAAAVGIVFSRQKPLADTGGFADDFNLLGFLGWKWLLIGVFAIVAYVAIAAISLASVVWALGFVLEPLRLISSAPAFWTAFGTLSSAVAWGLLSLAATVPFLLLWLRHNERRDSSHDGPEVNERLRREIVRREDWIVQNHMGSLVLVKPGVLRTLLVRTGHLGLGLLVRVTATNGYLGSMRTIHFAHWAFLNNYSRLLFFSNFDHSWDSYLDDFIEKAHTGLTMAWSCSVGFPETKFLIYDGATHGRQFKNWGLSTRAVSRFWYSAYPQLAVDQIERNYRIATKLAAQTLSDTEAKEWMRDL
jgi:hypothetical protein